MDYIKIDFKTPEAPEWFNELLMAELGDIGFDSFQEKAGGFEAFIPAKLYSEEKLTGLLAEQAVGFVKSWEKELIPDQNWNDVWEKNYFSPLVVSGRCVVRAPFHTDYPTCEYEIVIEPNMAFGTGNHETTSMMMEILLGEDAKGKSVLDMGCGTGILAILASMLGAAKIKAVDIDEWSYSGTIENAQLNRIQNITPALGDASILGDDSFDIILANIQRNVLLNDMEKYVSVLNPCGKLMMSGFYYADLPAIREKAQNLGLSDAGYLEKNNWVACTFKK